MVLQLTLTVWAGKTLQVQANLIDSHLADMNMNDCGAGRTWLPARKDRHSTREANLSRWPFGFSKTDLKDGLFHHTENNQHIL